MKLVRAGGFSQMLVYKCTLAILTAGLLSRDIATNESSFSNRKTSGQVGRKSLINFFISLHGLDKKNQ